MSLAIITIIIGPSQGIGGGNLSICLALPAASLFFFFFIFFLENSHVMVSLLIFCKKYDDVEFHESQEVPNSCATDRCLFLYVFWQAHMVIARPSSMQRRSKLRLLSILLILVPMYSYPFCAAGDLRGCAGFLGVQYPEVGPSLRTARG